jgi:hypothetical protein
MKSGRFIGQRWTDFAPWVDIMMPMTYRSHFQGSFEDYLLFLADVVRAQLKWAAAESDCSLLVGLDAHYIFREELEPWESALQQLKPGLSAERKAGFAESMRRNLAALALISQEKTRHLGARLDSFLRGDITGEAMAEELTRFLADPPAGFFPENKLIRAVETVRQANGMGVMIFAASHLTRKKLWGAVEKAFSFPAVPAQQNFP